ncbi:TPA: dephospho-CoA kinase [Elizabethkingia anophelis]|uniref:Dephospho-CoA kinase n=1 Tax=Elizabethkingia anophelis R26 TaxID=1246994 RepID=A0ABN5BVH2_9FLAO|nr:MULTISPECIES: dephospho-CoA kinase [Elizabethkingia]ATC37115.1 dephospho-CoA kinase [Elizabethkingia anophelis R26]ATC40793.1 dephospho-CoA kinase [Elizabethkingia anophelis Ag1]ATC44472.1 dephospho-CoA kinase [Elizabethkingia anophelis]ATC48148.1 dephospho-CoA kinase [Elizabethkingia anophelis]ELR79208.1 Dephospho-CoA kinase [Elizabethkingia anophelis R26]
MHKIIGLTGGIGSGKTTVARFIEEMGYPVYNSDTRAKDLVNESADLKSAIIQLLGKHAYDENGLYDRKYVGSVVFSNDELLKQLNAIIHPAVNKDFHDWVKKQSREIIFKETALLFELKLNLQCDKSLLVTADESIRIKRVMDRDAKTYREVEKVIDNQMPERKKIRLADYIIENNSDMQHLRLNTEKIMANLISDLHKI